jgi:NAD(P)-dependent dehydrogenase (short-subunit alcohol dehydrogenase family)
VAFRLAALFDLTGRRAVVTGGNSGIGLAMARALGLAGARVTLAARRAEETERAVAALAGEGVEASGIAVDLARPDCARVVLDGLGGDASSTRRASICANPSPR